MKNHCLSIFFRAVSILLLGFSTLRANDESDVRSVFDRWIQLSNNWDPKITELYDDKCETVLIKHLKDGTTKVRKWTAAEWKKIIPKAMAYGKSIGAKDTFTDIKTEVMTDGRVRVTSSWSSQPANTTAKGMLTFAKSTDGKWRIVEDRTDSKE
jgi:hypothetical protein